MTETGSMDVAPKRTKTYDALVRGILTYRRMVKKRDLVQVFYIYICLCNVCPAHPCGDNPMREVFNYSKHNGIDLSSFLGQIQRYNRDFFHRLMEKYRSYSDCIGMAETGYIKRSFDSAQANYRSSLSTVPEQSNIDEIIDLDSNLEEFLNREEPNRRDYVRQTRLLIKKALMPLLDEDERRKRR